MKNPVELLTDEVRSFASENGMELSGRLIVGLSGGADSVTLLLMLKLLGTTPVCVHVNHMIRGAEADADEEFCRQLCLGHGVEFHAYRVNVPELSAKLKKGTEETARDERRRIFSEAVKEYGCHAVAVAHNMNDRAETLIFNLVRGSGPRGLGSIKPVRCDGDVVYYRPLLCLSRKSITEFLSAQSQSYVTDSTNVDTDYTRNYVRHEILPRLQRINPAYLSNINKAARLCAEADDLVSFTANGYLSSDGAMSADSLSRLHPATFKKVFSILYERQCGEALSDAHLSLIFSFVKEADNGKRLCFPSEVDLIRENGVFRFIRRTAPERYRAELRAGKNEISGKNFVIFIENADSAAPHDSYINIYKLVKRIKISSDIIKKGIYVRNREDGDFIVSSGMTHTVKKVLGDKKIPSSEKSGYPVICDGEGLLFLPPFYVRDNVRGDERIYLTYCEF